MRQLWYSYVGESEAAVARGEGESDAAVTRGEGESEAVVSGHVCCIELKATFPTIHKPKLERRMCEQRVSSAVWGQRVNNAVVSNHRGLTEGVVVRCDSNRIPIDNRATTTCHNPPQRVVVTCGGLW